MLHWFINFPEGLCGGYSGNFGFGLRTKSWNFGFWGGIPGTLDLDLGQKVGTLDFGGGGILGTSDLDLGQKVGTLDLGGYSRNFGFGLRTKSWNFGFLGGYSGNFGFGLRTKSWNFGFLGGYSRNFGFGLRTKSWNFGFWGGIPGTSDLDLGQKVGTLDFGGVFQELRIWT